MENLAKRLRSKGWSKAEINQAVKVFKKEKSKRIQVLDAIIYWFVLIVAIVGNIIISLALVPFLLQFNSFFLYTIIAVLALIFGFLFDMLIRDLEQIERKKVVIAGLFIPALAGVNVFYITNFSNYVSTAYHLNMLQNPLIISAVYVLSFIAPSLIYRSINQEKWY